MNNVVIPTNTLQNRYIALIGLGLTGLSVLIGILVYLDNKKHSKLKLDNERLQKEISTMELALKQKEVEKQLTKK